MSKSNDSQEEPLSDVDRILLFEWHARHLKSWWNTVRPRQYSVNILKGMDTPTFHLMSASILLLRKFYVSGHAVKLPLVYQSIVNELPAEERELRKILKQQQHVVQDYLRQPLTVEAPKGFRPDDVMYEIAYGLLIHSDVDRQRKLGDMSRGWMHDMLVAGEGHVPVLKTLATIEECRADGRLQLPEPYEAIWEPSEPEPMTEEDVKAMLDALGLWD